MTTKDRGEIIESLNDALGCAEHALAGLKLGVSAHVPLDDRPIHERFDLHFRKVDSDWVLRVVHGADGSSHPILNTSVATRNEMSVNQWHSSSAPES